MLHTGQIIATSFIDREAGGDGYQVVGVGASAISTFSICDEDTTYL